MYLLYIRPVLEYCAPVWHYALTKDQTQQIEKKYKNVLLTSCSMTLGVCHTLPCSILQTLTLWPVTEMISLKKFFRDITEPSSCLHCLLAPREQSIISCLRTSAKYSRVHTRTKRYCFSLIMPSTTTRIE